MFIVADLVSLNKEIFLKNKNDDKSFKMLSKFKYIMQHFSFKIIRFSNGEARTHIKGRLLY